MLKLYRGNQRRDIVKSIGTFWYNCNRMMSTFTEAENITNEGFNNLKRPADPSELNDGIIKKPCSETDNTLNVERIRKRKVAVLLAYSGQGYLGLQRNPNRKTIEGDLLEALKKCDLVNDNAFNQPQLIQFQRAARTDKGVSALRQVLSMKIPMNATVEEINKHLPEQIRVVAIRRVTKGFNSKTSCDGRTYSYMLPTFAFAPHEEEIDEKYRVARYIIDKIRVIISHFQGTHNFHNFTSRKRALDPSAKRYMVSLTCSDPFEVDGMEFATIYIKGQSFMLHQIRKMVGLAVAISRGLATEATIHKSFDLEKIDIPVAPSSGLLLEEVHYERYNKKFGSDGVHESLEWKEYNDVIEEFKKKFILPAVVQAEREEKSMKSWLETLSLHTYDVRTNETDDEISDEEDTPLMDGLIALNRAAEIVESGNQGSSNINNLDTLANAAEARGALNGENKHDTTTVSNVDKMNKNNESAAR